MKRLYLHIAFWFIYLSLDIALIYLWDAPVFSKLSFSRQLMLAISNSSVSLLPKIYFTYYLLYRDLPRLINNKGERKKTVINIILVFIIALIFYRGLVVFFIYPVIYKGLLPAPSYFNLVGFLGMLIEIGFPSSAAAVIKQIRLQLADKEREKNLVRDKLETELKFLKNQTNPHFLFNTLNNIYVLARKKSDETADTVMKLSKLLRFMLYESKNEQIRINDEIKILDDYIELEKIRYDDRLTVSFLREVDNENEKIAPLLLIPFVENAFKHGASESRFESLIHLDMKLQNGMLDFYIENTMEPNGKKNNCENIGLTNVKRQLELLYQEHEVSIEDKVTFFTVVLKINLRSYANI